MSEGAGPGAGQAGLEDSEGLREGELSGGGAREEVEKGGDGVVGIGGPGLRPAVGYLPWFRFGWP